MANVETVLGFTLMLAGVALILVAAFRALAHSWTLGAYETWVFPTAGIGLILLGRWLIA